MSPWDKLAEPTLLRLAIAFLLGALIGVEREWRQRPAGLRTNALVCFGAAAFVDLAATIGQAPDTVRAISYVISGIGFLGGGAILKEGFSVRGMTTAATLWCSAAVGACAGAGQEADAILITAFLLTANIALRPLSRLVDRRAAGHRGTPMTYRVELVCEKAGIAGVREAVLAGVRALPAAVHAVSAEKRGAGLTAMEFEFDTPAALDGAVAALTAEMALGEGVQSARWTAIPNEHG
ncbi:MAG TPA: methyltransferase [Solibacterales bacterium]|nr:methyltransferase [Bryobacterales bacterium]